MIWIIILHLNNFNNITLVHKYMLNSKRFVSKMEKVLICEKNKYSRPKLCFKAWKVKRKFWGQEIPGFVL